MPEITRSIFSVFNAPSKASNPNSSIFNFTPKSLAIFFATEISEPTTWSLLLTSA